MSPSFSQSGEPRRRLDRLLVEAGHFATRSRAGDAIRRGAVTVDGRVAGKPGALVAAASTIAVRDPARDYVSRAALKLIAGLDHFGFDMEARCALDIGASTGGFTQVLLERGVVHVFAIDVGHGQLHERLCGDRRVTSLEGLNARHLSAGDLDGRAIDAVVSDVSFISLKLALPPALSLAARGALGLFLVKPQFEAGPERIGKGGLVSRETGEAVAEELSRWLARQPGWESLGTLPSPIAGGDGNREYLLGGRKR